VAATKDAGLVELTDAMKALLRYAEDTVAYDDAKLALLGWGGKAAGTVLEAPGGRLGACLRRPRVRSHPQQSGTRQGLGIPRHRRQQSR